MLNSLMIPGYATLKAWLWGLGALLLAAAVGMAFYIRLQQVENAALKAQAREAVALSRASDQATLYAAQEKAAKGRESARVRASVAAAEASSPEVRAWADQELPKEVQDALH